MASRQAVRRTLEILVKGSGMEVRYAVAGRSRRWTA